MHRNEKILAAVDRSMRILEIGPLAAPIVPKSDGWLTSVVDHAPRETLVDKYRSDRNVDTSRIEEVDIVWSFGSLDHAVPAELHGAFDACIASHVFEHVPDPIGLMRSLERLLSPAGIVSLVVPDKRFCFDFFKPLSSVGELLDAHARGASRHSRKARFDHEAYSVRADGEFAWSRRHVGRIDFFSSLSHAKSAFDSHETDSDAPYVDVHGWHFTPASFELAMLELATLEAIDFSIARSFPTEGCEFYVSLSRGREVPETEQELDTRRLELLRQVLREVREQAELLEVSADTPGARAAELEHELSALLSSNSWRMTAPLRFIRNRVRRDP